MFVKQLSRYILQRINLHSCKEPLLVYQWAWYHLQNKSWPCGDCAQVNVLDFQPHHAGVIPLISSCVSRILFNLSSLRQPAQSLPKQHPLQTIAFHETRARPAGKVKKWPGQPGRLKGKRQHVTRSNWWRCLTHPWSQEKPCEPIAIIVHSSKLNSYVVLLWAPLNGNPPKKQPFRAFTTPSLQTAISNGFVVYELWS